jgi:predicted P-loop ATPase
LKRKRLPLSKCGPEFRSSRSHVAPPLVGGQGRAEAKVRFDSGAPWWLETAELIHLAADQQIERYEGDPWEEVIGPWLEARSSTSISEVLERCLQKPQALWTQTDKNRAARCLRSLGWERYRERQGSRLEWRYRKGE